MITPSNPVQVIPAELRQGTRLLRCVLALCRINATPDIGLLRSVEERNLFDGFKTLKRRQEFLAGRLAAYHALELLQPGKPVHGIVPGAMGQPTLFQAGSENFELSISHTAPWAMALACEPGFPVGVDLERADGSRQASLAEVLTDTEKSLFPEHVVAFSAKEALGKFLRCGFNASWQVFEIADCKKTKNQFDIRFEHFSDIRVLSCRTENFVLSLAVPGSVQAEINLEVLTQALKDH